MKTSDQPDGERFHLDARPELEAALRAVLTCRLRLCMAEAADGRSVVRCLPAERITDAVRAGLRAHGPLVRHVLTTWGDGYGFLLLCALWAGDVPREPFALRSGVTVTDAAPFLCELRRVAITGQRHARVRTGAFVEDVADLIHRPGYLPRLTQVAEAA